MTNYLGLAFSFPGSRILSRWDKNPFVVRCSIFPRHRWHTPIQGCAREGDAKETFNFFIDVGDIRKDLTELGFARPFFFLLMGLYWSTVNAVLEEYVWRWFFLRQLQVLFRNPRAVLLLSAAGFTLHHLIVVHAWLPIGPTLLVNIGIFCAGLHWSTLTLRHQSLLPACISHILADLAILAVGAWILA